MSILDELIKLRANLIDSNFDKIDEYVGICNNIIPYVIDKQHVETWFLFSGDFDFPIFNSQDTACNTPYSQYQFCDLYRGRQLELRILFLDHLINCYKAEQA